MQKELPEEFDQQIRALKKEGDNFQMGHKNLKAVEKYKEAITLLSEPIEEWTYIRILWRCIAENYWLNAQFNEGRKGGYIEALEYWKKIMRLPHSVGSSTYHFRIGQIRYELGQFDKAKDELMRAYLSDGMDAFKYDDKKYFELIRPIIEEKEDKSTYSNSSDTYRID